jgi:hypothetical protein
MALQLFEALETMVCQSNQVVLQLLQFSVWCSADAVWLDYSCLQGTDQWQGLTFSLIVVSSHLLFSPQFGFMAKFLERSSMCTVLSEGCEGRD